MTYLFLDDERNPKDVYWFALEDVAWNVVRNYQEFTDYIHKHGMPRHISFDHDLGEEKTGMDCAHFVVSYCLDHQLDAPSFSVHSKNIVGAENIQNLLLGFSKHLQHTKKTPLRPS